MQLLQPPKCKDFGDLTVAQDLQASSSSTRGLFRKILS